jgi:hypothetical protein
MSRPTLEDSTRPADGSEAWTTPRGLVLVTAPRSPTAYYRLWLQQSRAGLFSSRGAPTRAVKMLECDLLKVGNYNWCC